MAPADEVEYLGAYWVANEYNEGAIPSTGDTADWTLDTTGPSPNYNPVVPEAPTGLAAGYKSDTSVALFWNAPVIEGAGQVSSYNVYENGSLVATTGSTSFTVSGLKAHTSYAFSVSAADQFGTSGTAVELNYNKNYNYNIDPGANPTLKVVTDSTPAASSGKYFSPYLDMTQPVTDVQNISEATHLRDFTLAFMQTTASEIDSQSGTLTNGVVPTLSWGGLNATTLPTGAIIQEVKNVEAEGGTVTVSIGGYNGYDPAVVAQQYTTNLEAGDSATGQKAVGPGVAQATAVANLVQEYQSVLTSYGVTHLDFDIENAPTVNNTAANHLRDLAIKQLEANNPDLSVSFTVATTPKGLGDVASDTASDDLGVLRQAKADGVHITTLNIMTMDYFDGTTNMLTAAESAANHVEAQLQHMGLTTTLLGVTPMIGQNDDYGSTDPYSNDKVDEVFTPAQAKALETWASTKSFIAGLGEWEMTRDTASSTNTTGTQPNELDSGVVQSAYEFTHLLDAITTASSSGDATQQVATSGAHTASHGDLAAVLSFDAHMAMMAPSMGSHADHGWMLA